VERKSCWKADVLHLGSPSADGWRPQPTVGIDWQFGLPLHHHRAARLATARPLHIRLCRWTRDFPDLRSVDPARLVRQLAWGRARPLEQTRYPRGTCGQGALPFEQVCPSVNSTDEAAGRHYPSPPPRSGHSDDSRGPRPPRLGDVPDRRSLVCAPDRVGVAIENVLNHRLLQERCVARGWPVPEAACPWACLVDVEGRYADNAGAVADRRLVRVGSNTENVLRRAIRVRKPSRMLYARRQRKARTGCSSIAFGATPVWPCLKSKKATPVTRAFAQSWTRRRARAICRRRVRVAPEMREGDGDSAIIVRIPSLRTR
jgi:hypothetical protein